MPAPKSNAGGVSLSGLLERAAPLTKDHAPMRAGSVSRRTAETDVAVSIALDGTGKAEISTGVGFLDHMLELFARHGLFDLTVKVTGDLHVDQHHTTEDAGIALGQAFLQALGDKRGIARYADIHLPMDETLSRVAVDISGRAFLVFRTTFPTEKIGAFDTELVREWFQAFAMNAGIALHVETLYGDNSHHIAESCFKGLARALRRAVAVDPREEGRVPSTKGSL
jgi:imidazoleglycerol-phosphate dehydratase